MDCFIVLCNGEDIFIGFLIGFADLFKVFFDFFDKKISRFTIKTLFVLEIFFLKEKCQIVVCGFTTKYAQPKAHQR